MPSIQEIRLQLQQLATNEAKASFEKFVPGSQKVYGVRMPLVNDLAKTLKHEAGIPFIKSLWKSGSFEEKILAAKLVNKIAKKHAAESIALVSAFAHDIRDWAVCDTLGMQSLKPIAATHSKEIFELAHQLKSSEDMWQRRLSLVLVEVYTKNKSLHPQINALIRYHEKDREYYVKKAVAWLKRNMKK